MADNVVRDEVSQNRKEAQDSNRHHGGAESGEVERQRLGAGTARRLAQKDEAGVVDNLGNRCIIE